MLKSEIQDSPKSSSSRRWVLSGALLCVTALFALYATHEWSAAKPAEPDSTAASSAEQAGSQPDTSLIGRLMPQSSIRSVEKLDFGQGTFVWEVDMLVDKDKPETSGFAYLSADGTKLLRGPLMDKRSKVMNTPPPTIGSPSSVPTLPPSPPTPPVAATASTPPQDFFDPQPALEAQARKASWQRRQFFSGISQLNYISTTKGSNVVYVLFDPLCHACEKLYKQHTAVAAAYDVEFRWIPVFLNEQSWAVSALLQKVYNEDAAKGLSLMDQMLSKQWKVDDHLVDIASLTDADKEQIVPAGGVFREIARAVPGIGTPFVTFKGADGQIQAFGGVPLANDWSALKGPSQEGQ